MKGIRILLVLCVGLWACSCDDSTEYLGSSMMPTVATASDTVFWATSRSVASGTLLSRSSKCYFGRMTDPETNSTITAEFLTQFNCNEGLSFPDSIIGDSTLSINVRLYVESFLGDSLQTMKLSVYPLDSVMDPNLDVYTDIDMTEYYDETQEPIAEKTFTITDHTLTDTQRSSSSYLTHINIPLPKSVGDSIYKGYKEHPEYFTNSDAFIRSGMPCSKGLYFKWESGNGVIATIDVSMIDLAVKCKSEDTDTTTYVQFAATQEVIQATHFEYSNNNIQRLIDDESGTYLKTPAGIFTEITLPVEEMVKDNHDNDTINSVALTLTRYNDETSGKYKLTIPQNLLLVRVDDYKNEFFEKYEVADSKTSYVTSFTSASNTYSFSNISRLMIVLADEYRKAQRGEIQLTENWNKVYIIPVDPTEDSSGNLVRLDHDFTVGSTKLVGGRDKIKVEVIYSRFN